MRTLEHAIRVYREQCQPYLWDVYDALAARYSSSLRLLEYCERAGKALTPAEIAAAQLTTPHGGTPQSTLKHVRALLSQLATHGLLHRATRPAQAATYRISDLGEQVMACHHKAMQRKGGADGTCQAG